jgi:hypothetical protein
MFVFRAGMVSRAAVVGNLARTIGIFVLHFPANSCGSTTKPAACALACGDSTIKGITKTKLFRSKKKLLKRIFNKKRCNLLGHVCSHQVLSEGHARCVHICYANVSACYYSVHFGFLCNAGTCGNCSWCR